MRRHSPHRQKQPECLRMPHSTNLTFNLVELHGLKWFNFSMRPTRSLSLGDGCRRDRVNRRVVERHMAASGLRRSTLKFVQDRLVFNRTHVELLRLRLLLDRGPTSTSPSSTC